MDAHLTTLADAQRRLLLVLRARHGGATGTWWADACREAGVTSAGQLSLSELDRVTTVLVARGGVEAVAARSCRVRLVPLAAAHRPGARPTRSRPEATGPEGTRPEGTRDEDAVLDDAAVRAALRVPDALDPVTFRRRLAELATTRRLDARAA